MGAVKWFIIPHSFDAELYHECRSLINSTRLNLRQYKFWVPDPRSIRFLLFSRIALFFSSELGICVFSVHSFTEHYIALTSRYSSNSAFQVQHHNMMWLSVMIFDYDRSVFPPISPHHVSPNLISAGGSSAIRFLSFAIVLFCWVQPVDVLIAEGIWFWKASSLVSASGCIGVYLDLCTTVLNCYLGLY